MTGCGTVEICQDDDGWWVAECGCGWVTPACPDLNTAAEVWGGHLVDEATR